MIFVGVLEGLAVVVKQASQQSLVRSWDGLYYFSYVDRALFLIVSLVSLHLQEWGMKG